MKKFLLLIFALVSCSVISDTSTETVTFDQAIEDDIFYYNLYIWVGTDTTQCDFSDSMIINDGHTDFYSAIFQESPKLNSLDFLVESDGVNYFSVVLQAVDTGYRHSVGGWATVGNTSSNFKLTVDKKAPDEPSNVRI